MKQISIFFLSFWFSVSVGAQQISQADKVFVDSIMNANYNQDGPGAVILVAKNGEPVFRKAYGMASMELNVPNKPENVFRIASMSKQFTAVCVLKLAQEGKLALQDDIRKYLPGYNSHGKKITIENLLNQTSGIPSYSEMKKFGPQKTIDQSREDLLNFFMNDSLLFEPGTDWSYSNSNYIVVGLIIEKVSGISLTDYYQQNIFAPLGMSHTSVGNYDSTVANASCGYEAVSDDKYRPGIYESWTWSYGCGQIVSTADDLLKWDNALYSDKIVKQELLRKAWKPFVLPNGLSTHYGFGWSVCYFNGMQFIFHDGSRNGFVSTGMRIPSEQLYIVILSNNESSSPWSISESVAMRLTKQTLAQPFFIPVNNKLLNDYTGVYDVHRIGARVASNFSDEKQYRWITIKGDTLFSQASGGSKEALHCIGKDLFVSESDARFHFKRNKTGVVESLEIYYEPLAYGSNEMEIKTDLPVPKEKQAVIIDEKIMETFQGKYDFGSGYYIQISVVGKHIYMQDTWGEKEEIFAENETTFFLKSEDASMVFIKENGIVTGLILDEEWKQEAKKID